MDKREFLYIDENRRKAVQSAQTQIDTKVATLMRYYKSAVTPKKKPSLEKILEVGGKQYVLDYFKLYGDLYPAIVNRAKVFKDATGLTIEGLDTIVKDIKDLQDKAVCKWIVVDNQVVANVERGAYDRFLNEDKRDVYELVKRIVQVSQDLLSTTGQSNAGQLQRAAPYGTTRLQGLGLAINLQFFAS